MTTTINASTSTGLVNTADTSGIIKLQSNGVTTNALAWVYYNAATATIVASYNISSVTVVTAGEFLFNFTNALTNGNYVIVGNADKQDGNGYTFFPNNKSAAPYYVVPSTTSFGGVTSLTYNQSLRANCEYTYAVVFGQ